MVFGTPHFVYKKSNIEYKDPQLIRVDPERTKPISTQTSVCHQHRSLKSLRRSIQSFQYLLQCTCRHFKSRSCGCTLERHTGSEKLSNHEPRFLFTKFSLRPSWAVITEDTGSWPPVYTVKTEDKYSVSVSERSKIFSCTLPFTAPVKPFMSDGTIRNNGHQCFWVVYVWIYIL